MGTGMGRYSGCRGSSNVVALDWTGIGLGSWVGEVSGVAVSRVLDWPTGTCIVAVYAVARASLAVVSESSSPQMVEDQCACWRGAAAPGEPTPPQLSPHEAPADSVLRGPQDVHEIATFFALLGLHT